MRTRLCDMCVRVSKREVLVSQMGSRIIKLAELGFENHKNKNYCNSSTLQPMYLGNPQINNKI